jgi:hypothetical protein
MTTTDARARTTAMNRTQVHILIPEMMILDFQRRMRDLKVCAPTMVKARSLQTSFRTAFDAQGDLGTESLVFRRGIIGGGEEKTALNMIQRRKTIVLRIEDHTAAPVKDLRTMTADDNAALISHWVDLWEQGMESLKTRSILQERPVGGNGPDEPIHRAIRCHVEAVAQSEGMGDDIHYDTTLPTADETSSVVMTDGVRTFTVTGAYEAYASSLGIEVAEQIHIYDDSSLQDTLRIRHRRMSRERTSPASTMDAIRTLSDPSTHLIGIHEVREDG